MKLRNKKTGEIITKIDVSQDNEGIWILENEPRFYRSLAELNEEWEDYESKEPLIKDEKVRELIRAWAELNGIDKVIYDEFIDGCETYCFEDEGGNISIQNFDYITKLKEGKLYTIAELCGDEE